MKPSRYSDHTLRIADLVSNLISAVNYSSDIFWHPAIYVGNLSFIYHKLFTNIYFFEFYNYYTTKENKIISHFGG